MPEMEGSKVSHPLYLKQLIFKNFLHFYFSSMAYLFVSNWKLRTISLK